jgi:hypothetical protein
MNERIKFFAELAGSTHKQNLGVYQFFEHELEEFVELIVRECLVAIDPEGDLTSLREYAGRKQCMSLVKNHFGVE